MWYETAKPFVVAGDLQIVGVVQEQHAERARLYRQWKQFDFPMVQDATTELNLNVVPIPLLIDEYGIVRDNRPSPNKLAEFVGRKFEPPVDSTETAAGKSPTDQLIADGNRLLKFSSPKKIADAIAAFSKAVAQEPKNGKAHFSLGVAHRMRHDSPQRKPDDFNLASAHWSAAVAIDPNQYIWRRRIEQYGPRMIKPYPFYEWIDQAQQEIVARGETPVKLTVNLSAAEKARPGKDFGTVQTAVENPDPEQKILPVADKAMRLGVSVVPAKRTKAGEVVRVHLSLFLEQAEFNGEAGPIIVWIDEESNGQPEQRRLEFAAGENEKSVSQRSLDFEFKPSTEVGRECRISGFLLCHICDDSGVCVYRRKTFSIDVSGGESSSSP